MGEMTGEIKMARFLYLKGLTPFNGRDEHIPVNTPSLSINKARLILNKAVLFALNLTFFLARCSLTGNYLFPVWEYTIPSLGISQLNLFAGVACVLRFYCVPLWT